MVFAGTVKGKVFALVFVRGNMTHTDYKAIVKDHCIPNIKNLNGSTLDGITWQQDGANIHRNPKVKRPNGSSMDVGNIQGFPEKTSDC